MMNDRIVEKLDNYEWKACEMQDLYIGDVFRMFEQDGTAVNLGQRWVVTDVTHTFEVDCGITYSCSFQPIEGINTYQPRLL